MEKKIKAIPICGHPEKGFFTGKDKYLHIQNYSLSDRTPPISEDDSLFVLVKSGSGSITINGVELPLEVGSFCWLQSYHTFTIEPQYGETLEMSVCVYDYPLSSFLTFRELTPDLMQTIMGASPVLKPEGERLATIKELLEEFELENDLSDPGSALIKVSILGQLASIYISIGLKRLKVADAVARPLVWTAILYMSSHYVEDITAESVAERYGTDAATLNRELRKITGLNFVKNLNRIRVNISSGSILFEDLSFAYTAKRAGFASEVAFYRSFKKYWGITPQEYRDQLINTGEGVYRDMIMSTALMSVLNYIYINFSEQINLKALAKDLYTSESTIRSMISDKFGTSCRDVIDRNRIRHAEALLLTTDLPILDIAVHVGYNSGRTFTRSFKERNRMTPGEYRSVYRGGLESDK